MPITLIQLLLLIFFVGATLKTLRRLQRHELPPAGFLWVLLWIAGAAITLQPDTTFYFARLFGVQRGVDLVVYCMLASLSYGVFKIMITQERQQRDITKITRHLALQDDTKQPPVQL